jgi:hypothetical protein
MAIIDREVVYHQLVLVEISDFYEGLPKVVRYERQKQTQQWSKISLLCGVTGMKPNELIDWLINGAFEYAFSEKGLVNDEGLDTRSVTIQGERLPNLD